MLQYRPCSLAVVHFVCSLKNKQTCLYFSAFASLVSKRPAFLKNILFIYFLSDASELVHLLLPICYSCYSISWKKEAKALKEAFTAVLV